MTQLRFHWFLPTDGGDGRHIVGGGHGVAAESEGQRRMLELNAGSQGASVPFGGRS